MLSNVLLILLGAGLVSVGFLAAALAERIRNPRILHEAHLPEAPCQEQPPGHSPRIPRKTESTQWPSDSNPTPRGARIITINESSKLVDTPHPAPVARQPPATRVNTDDPVWASPLHERQSFQLRDRQSFLGAAEIPRDSGDAMGEDVIAALIAAGYKRPIATQAAWNCKGAERATIERWTVAALRRCGKGRLS